jgi:hypothetical protein
MRTPTLILTLIFATTAQAVPCHHYSKWLYPYPQPRCGLSARTTDRSWYVEIVLPEAAGGSSAHDSARDVEREAAIEKLKAALPPR